MALSPSIPTSFVPKQPVSPTKRPRSSGSNLFLVISLFIVGIAVVASGVVYLYSAYLMSTETSKANQVSAAESAVNPATVQQFIRLRDRLTAADQLLNQHIALSQFFNVLEQVTLQNVQFSSLKIAVNTDNSATIDMTGTAKDFNALAAESNAIAAQTNIQDAIFSGIDINTDGTVAFTLDATLAPALVIQSTAPSTTPAEAGTTASSTVSEQTFSTAGGDTNSGTVTTSP